MKTQFFSYHYVLCRVGTLRFSLALIATMLAGFMCPYAMASAQTAAENSKVLEGMPAFANEHATWAGDLSLGQAPPSYPSGSQQKMGSVTPTVPATTSGGLTIQPTFDASITGDPHAAAIEAMINQAISIYQSLFTDPITVRILFRYATTEVNGNPLPNGLLARSNYVYYQVPWNNYINALIADGRTGNDTTANASLPGTALSNNILPSSAGGRAVGLNTPGVMASDGTVGSGTFDGIITLNRNQPFQFSRPSSGSTYDALRSAEHEMDEVLGLGSSVSNYADLRPQDLFSWSGPGTRSTSSSGSRYFSINGGNTNIVNFNQSPNGDFGDWFSPPCPNQANPYVQNAFSCENQFSDVTATSPEGINLDVIGYDAPTSTVLANISTRLDIETGADVLIGGFIVRGTQPKRVILRALGPSLPLAGTISDTVLELHDSGGGVIASNDDWQSGGQVAEIIATGLQPADQHESALIATLPANDSSYTAVVSGFGGATGIGLVEVYDLDRTVDSKMANISTRGLVTTGNNVMIGGLIVVGTNPATVLFRAIGPSLALVGVPNSLADTTLELYDSNGNSLAFNDDWQTRPDGGSQAAEIIATGLPPTDSRESALLIDLSPAAYTVIVRGFSNLTGVAVVEAYQLQ